MVKTFDEMQKLAQDGVEAAVKSLGAVSQGAQALSAEVSEYAQKALDDTTSATERFLSARTLESAVAVQTDYLKAAYEGFVTRSTKIGSLYADLAKDAYKPIETYLSKATPAL
ncbi:MAG: phasin family protein [Variibacter sp.]